LATSKIIRAFVAIFFRGLVLLLVLAGLASSQEFPDKIRGYKVYVASAADQPPVVRLATPVISIDGLLSVAVEAGVEFTSPEHSGRVEFLTFQDIRVNGIRVDVGEYRHGFKFRKGRAVPLPAPIRGRIGIGAAARTAYRELTDSHPDWRVTGTVFVFGRFKRFGFSFKRVVPVRLDLKIDNPLRLG